MNDIKVLWIGISCLILLFKIILNNMFYSFMVKKNNFFFFLNPYYYYYLFNILKNNTFSKINTIIDIIAIHYPDNLSNEFELLYVNIFSKLALRFFFKIFFKKEDLTVSISSLFNSTTWLEREI
jgi:NADH:ubiquinone oxidoreductase subunit C